MGDRLDGADRPYVGRGGEKLASALAAFGVDPGGLTCADLGANVGGFTDCLLRSGAGRVFAVDTGYGVLDWRLRNDPRVVVMERTNALRADPPPGGVDLVVIDLGWTPQRQAVPAALCWLKPGAEGRIITLIKPHYEASAIGEARLLNRGVLDAADAEAVALRTIAAMPELGAETLASTPSPITGGAGKRRRGNPEWIALLAKSGAFRPVDGARK